MIYLDTSALAKLILDEAESEALGNYLNDKSVLATSALTRTELPRAIRRQNPSRLAAARRKMRSFVYLELSDAVFETAAVLDPATLRTLDAIHLASALTIRRDLDALVAYDDRLLAAADALGLPTARPE